MTDKAQPVTVNCEGRLDKMVRDHRRPCEFCRRQILFMRTYLGQSYAFDAEIVPCRYDVHREGWAPGAWVVGGRTRCLMAPVYLYPQDKQARVEQVLVMHKCPGRVASRQRLRELALA